MKYQIEVCIDNLESLHNAIAGGATRIELCSSLALGGLTPSYGLMKKAASISSIPVYAMIRPRQGDFLYQSDDVEAMLEDIYMAKQSNLQGVVFGALTKFGDVNLDIMTQLMREASGLGVTFHRAIDQCQDYALAIENIAELGCERILTSGLSSSAIEGKETIATMVKLAEERFSIMAGAGVSASNAKELVLNTGIKELHLSGRSTRPSAMKQISNQVQMGAQDDFLIPVTSVDKVQQLASALTSIC